MKNHKFTQAFIDQLASERKRLRPDLPDPEPLDWLNADEPKHPNEYPLSKAQRATLIEMNNRENHITPYSSNCIEHTSSIGAHDYDRMKRLEKRGLIVCVGTPDCEGKAQIAYWKLTSAGQHTIYGLAEFLPF